MKGRNIILIAISIIILLALIFYFLIPNSPREESSQNKDILSIKQGYYLDENNKDLKCTTQQQDNYVAVEQFFNENNNLIGTCSSYNGPGASGCWKGSCSSEILLREPCQSNSTRACGTCEGVKLPKYNCII